MSFIAAGCAVSDRTPWNPDEPDLLHVVATFSILGDWVEEVGGDRIAVRTLVGPENDPHTFESGPPEARTIYEADLVFEIGYGFEPWLDSLFRSTGSKARRISVLEGLALIRLDHQSRDRRGSAHRHDHHHRGEFDPHVWHDVTKAEKVVTRIATILAEYDSANASYYRERAERYIENLRSVHDWVVEQMESIPRERRKLVTGHDVFQYFGRRYGIEVTGAILDSATTEAADPSAGDLVRLVNRMRAHSIAAVFPEAGQNPALIRQIARETGIAVGPPLYTDALSHPGGDAATYLDLIHYNVMTIVNTLSNEMP